MFSDHFIRYAQNAFENRLPLLGETGTAVAERLLNCPDGIRELLQFYYGFMPLSDALPMTLICFTVTRPMPLLCGRRKRAAAPFRRKFFCTMWLVSDQFGENRGLAVPFFRTGVSADSGADETQAVLTINYWCASQASYEASDERTQSPLSVYRSRKRPLRRGSTFLVSVLRSVGIPARQVYVPRWAHCDDNHAWVEVYVGGSWHFLGACEPEEVLDRGWFTNAAHKGRFWYMPVPSRITAWKIRSRAGTAVYAS